MHRHQGLNGQKTLLGTLQFDSKTAAPFLYTTNTTTLRTEAYTLTGTSTGIEILANNDPEHRETHLYITPNPVQNLANIWFTTDLLTDAHLRIFNVNGHLLYQDEHINKKNQNYLQLYTTDWPSGVYICVLETEDGTQTAKFIK